MKAVVVHSLGAPDCLQSYGYNETTAPAPRHYGFKSAALVTPHQENQPDALLEHYDGKLQFVDASGNIVVDQIDPTRYQNWISESVKAYSYLESPYFKPKGYPNGIYRVGPLAQLNIVDRCGTPKADREWANGSSSSVMRSTCGWSIRAGQVVVTAPASE